LSGKDRGFAVISMLLALAVIAFLYFYMMKTYFGKPQLPGELKESAAASGVDTASYPSLIKSAKDRVEQLDKRTIEEQEKMQKLLDQR
jgi:hypothetical protein